MSVTSTETSGKFYNPKLALGVFLVVVGLASFVPHRERELYFGQNAAAGFAGQEFANNTFIPEFSAPTGPMFRVPFVGGSSPQSARRSIPGRIPPLARLNTPSLPGGTSQNFGDQPAEALQPAPSASPIIPLGPQTPSVNGLSSPTGPAQQVTPSPFVTAPGGFGGNNGGGGSITPAVPIEPAPVLIVSPVPEPAVWLTLLLGFGIIGGGMRRRGRTALITQGSSCRP